MSAATRIRNLLVHVLPAGPHAAPGGQDDHEPDEFDEVDEPTDAELGCIRLLPPTAKGKPVTVRPRRETARRMRECATALDMSLGAVLSLAVHKMWMDLRAQEADTRME